MESEQVKILLVDDHEVVRRGVHTLLRRKKNFTVVGEAGTVAEAVQKARDLLPDVIMMDVRLPDGTGVEACREIRAENPNIKIIMLTSYSDDEAVLHSIMAGATGYLLKEIDGNELVAAINKVAIGHSLLDPAVTSRVLNRLRKLGIRAVDEKLLALSAQELKILELIADGKTNKEIADAVHLSDKTVKNYVSNILNKLELHRRAEAAAYLFRRKADS